VVILDKTDGVQVFDSDNVILIDKDSSDLVGIISPLISNTQMSFFKLSDSFSSAVRAFLAPGDLSLLPSKVTFRSTKKLWWFKELTVGRGDEFTDAQVQTYSYAGWLKRLWFSFARKASIVFTGLPLDSNGFYDTLDGAVELGLDFADVLDIEFSIIPDFGSIGIVELDRIKTITSLESRIAWFITRFDSAEEGLEGLIQSTKSALNRAKISLLVVFVGFSSYLVRSGLSAIGNRLLACSHAVLRSSRARL